MMKFLYLLVPNAIIVHLIGTSVAQYQWNCSEPDDRGQRYIPGVRDFESDVLTAATIGGAVNLYRVQPNLNAECHGEVTAIEYCYQYDLSSQETVFNWTVLIFEEANNFTVTKLFVIESCPSSLNEDSAYCMDVGIGRAKCCDRTLIEGFDLPMNNFIYGVTESAQGNTAGATLLGFHGSQSEYVIDTAIVPKTGDISVGSTLPRPQGVQRGLRMLWFVIGTPIVVSTLPLTTEKVFESTMTSVPITGQQENETTMETITSITFNSPGVSVTLVLIGVVVGSLLVLVVILISLLALVWMIKKYKRSVSEAQCNLHHQQKLELEGSEQREETHQQQQHQGDEVMEMKSNDAYISNTRQIITKDNVAYGQITPQIPTEDNVAYSQTTPQIPTEDNVAYGQTTPQITTEDNVAYGRVTPQIPTEDNVAYDQNETSTLLESNYNLHSDQCEYEYV